MRYLLTLLTVFMLASCGGGGGGGPVPTITPVGAAGCTPPQVQVGNACTDPATAKILASLDSLGRQVPESFWSGGDSGGGDSGGGSGDGGGADGSAGDGAPIANAPVVLTDKNGRTATTTTDALGYYRIKLTGFTPPFVVKVTRADGTVWYAGSTQTPPKRGFVTMNLTGLTDKTMGYVADASNIAGGAEKVTPLVLVSNPAALSDAKTRISTSLTSPLTYVGLDPGTFDPVASPYAAIKTDNYDRLLERLTMSKTAGTGNTVIVGTFAGVKESMADGTGTEARFNYPSGAAVDSSGNVYVADRDNHAIRKISPAGGVSTLAGSGSRGFADGIGMAASFNTPRGVAVDSSGNVYVADWGNHAIRKITPAGVVSTLAGSGFQGFVNGTNTAARFYEPAGVTVDSSGNVYVADRGNNAIRKISPAGVVSTLAGSSGSSGYESSGFANGTGTTAKFSFPEGVAVDSSGNVYVADTFNNAIRKISPAGVVSTFAGSGNPGYVNGTGTAASFDSPTDVAVDSSGNVYVADYFNCAIRKISPAGVVSTFAGSGNPGYVNGTGTAASFSRPRGVAVDSSGNVVVADDENNAIRKISPAGVVSTLAGLGPYGYGYVNGTGTAASFHYPTDDAVDSIGNVYVADKGNHAIRKISPAGVVSTLAGSGSRGFANGTGTAASFNDPEGVAVDSSGNVYVADKGNYAIRKITPAGVVSTLAGGLGYPTGVAVDSGGNVYVADGRYTTTNVDSSGSVTVNFDYNAIRKISPAGVVSTVAGSGTRGFADGTGAAATFNNPAGVAVDSRGNVYVADSDNHAIRKITPAGVVSTLAGSGWSGFANGTGAAAMFRYPDGVAVDSSGNVYVADSRNHAIRKITPAGVVSTVAGDGTAGYRNASNTGARFMGPRGVAIDQRGNIFVADSGNHAIRLILP